MKLVVGAVEYDISDTLNNVTLGNLDRLQSSSRTTEFPGVTRKSIKETFLNISRRESDALEQWVAEHGDDSEFAGVDGDDYLADPDFRRSLIGLIFLAKRMAGEEVTWAQAGEVSIADWRFVPDEADEVEAPKVPEPESPSPTT